MCGRCTLTLTAQEIAEITQIVEEIDWKPRYNIAPTQAIPVVVQEERRRLTLMRWGLVPHWAKDATIDSKMINARSETVDSKPSFRHSFVRKRCLILADGYYEWKREGKSKTPYRIVVKDRPLFGFAGIWDSWLSPLGQPLETCSILTMAADEWMLPLHDRMPVILRPEQEVNWLDPRQTDPAYLKSLFQAYPPEQMEKYPVSPLVNSPKNDRPACIEPMGEMPSLFS